MRLRLPLKGGEYSGTWWTVLTDLIDATARVSAFPAFTHYWILS
jgi:hypothetical protein